ncbi:LYPD3 protein, partial [Podilymbus podiceps]|nr:LYPD3 protein [Podilymbus podiceps]
LGNLTLWRELRGCAREPHCGPEWRGDEAVGLSGSCCAGPLCNRQPSNESLFEPHWPRLQRLPHGHAHTPPPDAAKM